MYGTAVRFRMRNGWMTLLANRIARGFVANSLTNTIPATTQTPRRTNRRVDSDMNHTGSELGSEDSSGASQEATFASRFVCRRRVALFLEKSVFARASDADGNHGASDRREIFPLPLLDSSIWLADSTLDTSVAGVSRSVAIDYANLTIFGLNMLNGHRKPVGLGKSALRTAQRACMQHILRCSIALLGRMVRMDLNEDEQNHMQRYELQVSQHDRNVLHLMLTSQLLWRLAIPLFW